MCVLLAIYFLIASGQSTHLLALQVTDSEESVTVRLNRYHTGYLEIRKTTELLLLHLQCCIIYRNTFQVLQ